MSMRVGDDRVDVTYEGFASPLDAIEDWERTYWQAFETGHSDHPVMRADLDQRVGVRHPGGGHDALLPCHEGGSDGHPLSDLRRSAALHGGQRAPAGRAMTYILGVRSPYTVEETLPHADDLSIAMQLSNFWRDIGPDWRIGRVYLPGEDLARFRVTEADLAAGRITPDFIALLEFEIARTEAYYQSARIAVRRLRTGRVGVMAASEVYRAILPGIRRNGYDVFTRRCRHDQAAEAGAGAARTAGGLLALRGVFSCWPLDIRSFGVAVDSPNELTDAFESIILGPVLGWLSIHYH